MGKLIGELPAYPTESDTKRRPRKTYSLFLFGGTMCKEQRKQTMQQALKRLKKQIERGEIDNPVEREKQLRRAYGERNVREGERK